MLLTGDTLFIGDVGRPDLLVGVEWSTAELAGRLHDSVHDKLLVLPDATRVYPAHDAGSACDGELNAKDRYQEAVRPTTRHRLGGTFCPVGPGSPHVKVR